MQLATIAEVLTGGGPEGFMHEDARIKSRTDTDAKYARKAYAATPNSTGAPRALSRRCFPPLFGQVRTLQGLYSGSSDFSHCTVSKANRVRSLHS